jgi:hypothetical protein
VAVAGVPAAVQGEDAALLAQVARFDDLYDAWVDLHDKAIAHSAAVKALPDYPSYDSSAFKSMEEAQDAWRREQDFVEAHNIHKYWDQGGRLGERVGALANAIFEIPAETVRGAFEKLKIAHIVVGNNHQDGDESLDAYQDWDEPWMETVIADFERLIAGMRP